MEINFNNRTFSLVKNSGDGKANGQTVFKYSQKGNLVTADYYGGSIVYGKIIAVMKYKHLHMQYQCLTTDNELVAGNAVAMISRAHNNKIKLKLYWQWMGKKKGSGISEYIEN
jgi:hypothetical protein